MAVSVRLPEGESKQQTTSLEVGRVLAGSLLPERLADGALLVGVGLLALLSAMLLALDGRWLIAPLTAIPVALALVYVHERRKSRRRHRLAVELLTQMMSAAFSCERGHLARVCDYADRLGAELGLKPRRRARLTQAALLHDIGKLACDEAVLEKPARLTPEEYEHVKLHCDHSARILADCSRMSHVRPLVRMHHERPDGKGYPLALVGDGIPLESQIISVVDAYDAMVGGGTPEDSRSYRDPLHPWEAVRELKANAGTQFDPRVVSAFVHMLHSEGRL